ncbi:uncharacterized protein LOC143469595 [Clavelina lepadiformis]|uniref:uncharacterized protein LOC143469595 n=1 Tax=Clavelina lepadiformis TaxID=159417 RepID=UPI004040FDE3
MSSNIQEMVSRMPGLLMIFDIIGWVVYAWLLAIYFPIYVLGYLVIQKNLLFLRLRKLVGFTSKSKLGLVSRKFKVKDVSQVSTEEEIDFQANRSMQYVHRMTMWTPKEIVKCLLKQQTIQLISDQQLAYVILCTVFAHSVRWDAKRKMYRFDLEGFEDLFLFQGFYWDARLVWISATADKLIIKMDDGEEYSSDCDPENRADYDLAKLHVQICLSYFAPGLAHNHVHFVFPSAVCVLSKRCLNHNSTLYKLLAPHFRFTERINYQALRVGKATNNKRSILDRIFFLWQPFPVTKEQFMEGVARKCRKYYFDRGSVDYGSEAAHRVRMSRLPSVIEEEDHTERKHFVFPPDYVSNKTLQKIPYLAFLNDYYTVVRRFVKAMEPFIEKDQWEILSKEVAEVVPLFNQVNMVDAIATFIHQVGVVHFCDHNSYLRYFAYKYGSMAIRTPFESFKNTEHWLEQSQISGFDVNEVKKNPLSLIWQRDVMRTRCFLNIFVDYIPNPDCDLQLVHTDYEFEPAGAKDAARDFISQLRSLDGNLKKRPSPIYIPQLRGEKRAAGSQITRLDEIVRCVCY